MAYFKSLKGRTCLIPSQIGHIMVSNPPHLPWMPSLSLLQRWIPLLETVTSTSSSNCLRCQEAEVEHIINSKHVRNTIHYLIHWKGFPHEENEWIPIKELTNVQIVIKEFHHSNPNAPWLTIKIKKMNTDFKDTPCTCLICLWVPLPSPSPLFQTPECKELKKIYNKYDSSFFEIPPVE